LALQARVRAMGSYLRISCSKLVKHSAGSESSPAKQLKLSEFVVDFTAVVDPKIDVGLGKGDRASGLIRLDDEDISLAEV
jgi:hypothetical protein